MSNLRNQKLQVLSQSAKLVSLRERLYCMLDPERYQKRPRERHYLLVSQGEIEVALQEFLSAQVPANQPLALQKLEREATCRLMGVYLLSRLRWTNIRRQVLPQSF